MERIANFIGGTFAAPRSGRYLDNVDPASGVAYSLVPDSDGSDVDDAVRAAEAALPAWTHTPAAERSRILLRLADLIDAQRDELAHDECVDTGKPISLARTLDIPRSAINFRFFGSAILHLQSESHATDHVAINYTLRRPRGVCGLISPWNLPLYLLTWKIAPAIAVGNTAVAKPSELTPMTAFRLGALAQQAGLPAGVLNIVHGAGATAGAALVQHPGVSTISFTGGTATGREIARTAAPMFKKLSLELGGKNPTIVFADADRDESLRESVRAAFSNQGQICLCGSRVFVERSIYSDFVDRFVAAAKALRIGDPLDESTQHGAVVSRTQMEKDLRYIQWAREDGGAVRCGGAAPPAINQRCRDGFFLQPTVITDLDATCRVNQEEIFGPVACIIPFDSEQELLAAVNGTSYGLSASVWTSNIKRAHRLAEEIQSGTVWINCWLLRDLRVPFGGMKQSGVGREGGEEAIRFFTEPKNVCVRVG